MSHCDTLSERLLLLFDLISSKYSRFCDTLQIGAISHFKVPLTFLIRSFFIIFFTFNKALTTKQIISLSYLPFHALNVNSSYKFLFCSCSCLIQIIKHVIHHNLCHKITSLSICFPQFCLGLVRANVELTHKHTLLQIHENFVND